jgi:hypothetical protein
VDDKYLIERIYRPLLLQKKLMQDNLFFNTEVTPIEILDQLYKEASIDSNYYESPAIPPVMRCDVSREVREYFKKFIAIPFRDCGFLKTPPNSIYPLHKDSFRITALNMLMVDQDEDFETFMLGTTSKGFTRHHVPYVKSQFMMLNVMNPHGVINKSKSVERIVLSIGITDADYQTCLQKFLKKELFNVALQKD